MEVKRRRVHPEKRTEVVERVKKEEFRAEKVERGAAVDAENKATGYSFASIASPGSGSSGETASAQPTAVPGRTTGPTRRSSKGGWTEEEDQTLSRAVSQFGGKNWKKIAEFIEGRTDIQCLHRWQKVLNPNLIKGTWTKEEDEQIIELVNKYGSRKWSTIASKMPGRIGKQCRERWHNHLKPTIKKDAWTTEEEMILIHAHHLFGNKWVEISKLLPGRTDNSIKNHWNCCVKKKLDSSPETAQMLASGKENLETHGCKETSGQDTPHGKSSSAVGITTPDDSLARLSREYYSSCEGGGTLSNSAWQSETNSTEEVLIYASPTSYADDSYIKNSCGIKQYHQRRALSLLHQIALSPSDMGSSSHCCDKMVMDLDYQVLPNSFGPLCYPPLRTDEDKELHLPDCLLASFISPDSSLSPTHLQGTLFSMSPRQMLRNSARSFKNIPSILRRKSGNAAENLEKYFYR